jgi:ribokinase
MKYDVVTFGSAVVDVFVETEAKEKGDLVCYPVGGKVLINDLIFDIGGGGTNTAVAFARFGLKTGYIGKVGDDSDGKKILDLLKKEKVAFLGKIDKKCMTGYSVILDSSHKDRTILTYKGANDDLSFDELNKKIETKWLYFSSLLGKSFQTQKKLAEIMVNKGTKIAFNPSSYLIKNHDLSSLLKLCEVLIVNKEEAKMLTAEEDLFRGIVNLGPKIVIITDMNNPAQCYDGQKLYSIIPHNIKVVERTGAGDAFASGFVAGLVVGKSIPACLSLALKESESVLRYFGAKNKLIRMNLKKEK